MMFRNSLIVAVSALMLVCAGAESPAHLRRSSLVMEEEELSNAVVETPDESGMGQRRELWSWWSMLFLVGPHHPCPPHGPLSHAPHCLEQENVTSTTTSEASYESASEVSAETANMSSATVNRNFPWMLLVAGVAATAALAAAAIGSRKEPREKHQLEGSIKRRITLFSTFADNSLCGGSRPDRVVEMTASGDGKDTPYRLA